MSNVVIIVLKWFEHVDELLVDPLLDLAKNMHATVDELVSSEVGEENLEGILQVVGAVSIPDLSGDDREDSVQE